MILGVRASLMPFHEKYLPNVLEWINDPGVRTGTGTEGPVSDFDHRHWYERQMADSSQRLFIIGKGQDRDAEPIGLIGLKNIAWRSRSAEYWIYVGPAEARGQGFATEATHLLLRFGFLTLGLNRVYLRVLRSNLKAIALYEKFGLVSEGIGRQEAFADGRFVDMIHYSMLASEFKARYSSSTGN